MTSFAGEWVRAIVGAALICAAATVLTPKGKVKNVLRLVCGIVLIITMIDPLLKQELPAMSMNMSEYRLEADEITASAEEKKNSLSRTLIEDELETYILDKAKSLNAQLQSAELTVKWGDEACWYPYEVTLTGNVPQREQSLLSNAIEAELGIPEERQYWSAYEG